MRGKKQGRYSLWATGILCGLVVGMLWGEWAVGQGTVEEAAHLNEQAVELHRAGRYREAIPLAERVLAIREHALGPDAPQATWASLACAQTPHGAVVRGPRLDVELPR